MSRKAAAKFQILVFLGGVIAATVALDTMIIFRLGTTNTLWSLLLMWIPGLVGLACSKAFGYNLHDIGFKQPAPRFLVLAYLVPAAAAILILLISILIGTGQFEPGGAKQIVNRLIFAPTLGVVVSLITALGEEIGWRGFLYSRIHEWDLEHPNFVIGIISAAWHWPLLLFTDYSASPYPIVSALLFTISITAFSIFLGQLRRISRSIWAPALAHAVHITWVQGICPGLYQAGALDPFFGGESGVILAVLYLLLAIYLQKKPLR